MSENGYAFTRQSMVILPSSTATATGGAFVPRNAPIFFTATEAGTGAVTATVIIEASNDPTVTTSWLTLGTITLSGTTTAQDGFSYAGLPANVRPRLSTISGTGAAVIVTMAT